MDIIKPFDDKRIIKYFILKNKLKYVCIQDDDIDTSYIVACVNVGSTGNKEYYDGIAHLLEHMCFITSNKYKEKGYINNKATEFGGYTNAYTDDINTVYYYKINTIHLNEMLEIFADYLFNSELNEKYVLDEIHNVNSEHNKNINNDGFRIYNIENLLCDKHSEFNSFFTGSLETLNKPDIVEKMLDFYKKYYVPENISLCVVSNLKINEIDNIVKNNFNNIKSNNIFKKINIRKPLYTENINKGFIINSINKTFTIKYIFETLELNKYNNTKAFFYISFLLNTDMKDSLNDFLKINNYITNLHAHFEPNNGLFFINFELTNKGFKNIKKIDGYLRYYIKFILNLNFKNLYNILKIIDDFNFNNKIKGDTLELAQSLAINCFKYDIKNIYCGDYLFLEYNEDHIKDIHKFLNFDNSIQLIITHKFNKINCLIDPYYGTKYKQIKKIISEPIKFNINLNLENKYINANTKLIFYKNLKNEIPFEITKNNWFGNTSKFNEKINHVNIIFSNKKFFNSPKNTIYTHISIYILEFLLNRELSDAVCLNYNFNFDIVEEKNEIILELSLINDKKNSQKFIDFILDFIINTKNKIELNNDFILQQIKNFKIYIKNIKYKSSWEYISYLIYLNYENSYHYDLIINELKNISIDDFIIYYNNLFNNSNCITFTYGNIDTNYNFSKIEHYLNNNYNHSNIKNLPKNINIIHPNKKEINNCISFLIKIEKYNEIIFLHTCLASLIIKTIFYNKLRTDKQLGYLVSFSFIKIDKIYYFIEKIQSDLDLNFVSNCIFEFNNNLLDYLHDIDFNSWINNLKYKLSSKEDNLNELFEKKIVK